MQRKSFSAGLWDLPNKGSLAGKAEGRILCAKSAACTSQLEIRAAGRVQVAAAGAGGGGARARVFSSLARDDDHRSDAAACISLLLESPRCVKRGDGGMLCVFATQRAAKVLYIVSESGENPPRVLSQSPTSLRPSQARMATASRLVRRFSASPARSAAASFFPTVPKLKYEGPTTRNPRACPRAPRSFFARAACRPRAAPARLRPAGQRARPFALSASAGACRRRARACRHRFLPLPLLSSAVPPARSRLCAIQCVRGRHGPHDEGLAALFGVLLAHVPRVSFRAPPPPHAPFRRARSPSGCSRGCRRRCGRRSSADGT